MTGPPATARPATHPRGRIPELLIWVVLTWSAALILVALILGLSTQPGSQPIIVSGPISNIGALVISLGYGLVFAVLASKRPNNPVGWMFGAVALINGVSSFAWGYVTNATETIPPRLPLPEVVGWIGGLTLPIWSYLLVVLILFFPDGKPLSPAWSRWADAAAALAVVGVISMAFGAGQLPNFLVENPFGAPGALGDGLAVLGAGVLVAQALLVLPSLWSLAIRYRRADRTGRRQLKWFIYAVAVFGVIAIGYVLVRDLAFTPGSSGGEVTWLVFCAGATLIPVATLIAILRHDLFRIDALIGRTFVYASLTAILAGVYTAGIRLFNWIFVEMTGESSDVALVLTTLVLATTFTPIKGRLERIAGERLREKGEPAPDPAPDPAAAPTVTLDLEDPQVQAFAEHVAEIVRSKLEVSGATRRATSRRRTRPKKAP